jgi:hypothetical protein
MGRIEVNPGALRDVGASAQQLGSDVTGLAGSATALSAAGGAPSATASALGTFGTAWSRHVARTGDAMVGLGQTTGLAAGLYEQTDAAVMPGA